MQPWERHINLWWVAGPLDVAIVPAKWKVSGGQQWSAWPSVWWMENVFQEWWFRVWHLQVHMDERKYLISRAGQKTSNRCCSADSDDSQQFRHLTMSRCCLACREGPVRLKLLSLRHSWQAVQESETQRDPSRYPNLQGWEAEWTALKSDEWIPSVENLMINLIFSPGTLNPTEGALIEVICSLQCKIPYLHKCLLVSYSEFFILQLSTKPDKLQGCSPSSILSQANPSHT